MPIIKSARPWDNFGTKLFVSLGAVWFGFVALVTWMTDNIAAQKTAGLISFIAFGVTFVVVMLRRPDKFRCLDCGGEVQQALESTRKGGEPVLRLCPRCDVLWHVGNFPDPD
jgi:hypothetical protein